MPYCDDFWHIDAHENILSPACLTVFVKSKTENQLIRFVIAYLVADNHVKCETMAGNARLQTSSLQTYGHLTVLTLILWNTGYVEYNCINVFIGNMLKLNADELNRFLIEAWFSIQLSVADQAIDQ